MFSSSKRVDMPYPSGNHEAPSSVTPPFSAQQATVIARGVRVEGEFHSQGDVIIEGVVEGNITSGGKLTVGPEAKIIANIQADEAKISGDITGDLMIVQQAVFHSTARILGDIVAEKMMIEAGAVINGHVSIGPKASRQEVAPVLSESDVKDVAEPMPSAEPEEEESVQDEISGSDSIVEEEAKQEESDTEVSSEESKEEDKAGQQQLQAIIHTTSGSQ